MPAGAESFDYIVTGAGSAGCAVAARLSESGHIACCCWKPAAGTAIPGSTSRWAFPGFSPIPASTGCMRANRKRNLAAARLYQPRGKVLGGTSSINGMVYMRGNAADYDEWRQRGCTGWD